MATVVLIQCNPEFKKFVNEKLPDYTLISLDAEKELLAFWDSLEKENKTVEVIIVGGKAKDPIRTAQKSHFIDKTISLMLLTPPAQLPGMLKAIQTSPLLGDEVIACRETRGEQMVKRITLAAKGCYNRRKYARSILQANADIPSADPNSLFAAKYLEQVLDIAPIGICLINKYAQVLAVNKYAGILLETNEREIFGKELFSFFNSTEGQHLADDLQKVRSSHAPTTRVLRRHRIHRPAQYIEVTITPFKAKPSAPDSIILLQDVTEKVEAIEHEKERVRLLALNYAKDEFLSLASHQLRTPATGVKQYVGMVLEGYAGDISEEQQRMLQAAYESNERQIKIVNDLLKVARIDAGKVVLNKIKSDLRKLLTSIIDEQSDEFRKSDQEVIMDVAEGDYATDIDPTFMRMAIENIVDNAHKYSPAGKAVRIKLISGKESVVVSVEDEGVGISPKDQKKLFMKFSRVDNPLSTSAGGTGLGLYWSKKIIELHGGDIAVKSAVDQGTTFSILIPKVAASPVSNHK